MKQKYCVAMMLAFLCLPVFASENYFRPGTVWVTEYRELPNSDSRLIEEFVEEEIEIAGQNVLPLYTSIPGDSENKKLQYYLKTEGERVYWRYTEPEYPDWYLMYDFSLTDGETAVITMLSSTPGVVNNYSVKCIATRTEVQNPDTPLMEMEQTELSDSNPNSGIETGTWIKGIGSLNGPSHNTFGLEGGIMHLVEVKSEGKTVYQAAASSVSEVDNPEIFVGTSGPDLVISGVQEETNVNVYDTSGKLIKTFTASPGETRISPETSGLFLVSIKGKTFKLVTE